MKPHVKLDLVTYDPRLDEFVLYIVEDGPWPQDDATWNHCLNRIQNQVLDACDAAVDGGLAREYPDSLGKPVRIQVDSPSGLPHQVADLVHRLDQYVNDPTNDYGRDMASSTSIGGLRIVTGHSLGRFNEQ